MSTILTEMGFDPNRKFQSKRSDYVLVAVALIVCVALLLWAIAG